LRTLKQLFQNKCLPHFGTAVASNTNPSKIVTSPLL